MSTNRLRMVAVALLAVPITATAVPVTIDFDNLAGETVLANQYSALGVTFSASDHGSPVGARVEAFGGQSGANVWTNCYSSFCAERTQRADSLRIDFASPVSGLQWFTDAANIVGLSLAPTFYAYDAGNHLLETVVAAPTILGTFALTAFSASGISYVEGQQPTDEWAYLIDTISFAAAAVDPGPVPVPPIDPGPTPPPPIDPGPIAPPSAIPEPATPALLVLGLAGLAFSRRRWQ